MLKCSSNLVHKLPYLDFFEWILFALMYFHETLQIALFSPLRNNDELVVVDERVQVLDDVWVV
jgi:hypothetical protein